MIDPSLFRAYDIRGIVGEVLNESIAHCIGRAIGTEAMARGNTRVVVGRDGRLSSEALAAAMQQGLQACGCDVIDIGCVPTPVLYFATHELQTAAGVMVTASHNPPEYNGFKVVLGGRTLVRDDYQHLREICAAGVFADGVGERTRADMSKLYLDRITGDVSLARSLRIVIDAGNGAAGPLAVELFTRLGCQVTPLFCDIDGRFPNHAPDPSEPENLAQLIAVVRRDKADLGLAFDGDGDRVGMVDANGKIIWPDRQLMLLAADVLRSWPGSNILYDVKSSRLVGEFIHQHGGVPIMWQSGHSVLKAKMLEVKSPLAGEFSGHIFIGDRWYGFDDGMYAAARLLALLTQSSTAPTAQLAQLPEMMSTQELRVMLREGEPVKVMTAITAEFKRRGLHVNDLDGVRLELPEGWGLVRASNTLPCLTLRFEAQDEKNLRAIQQRFKEVIHSVVPDLKFPF